MIQSGGVSARFREYSGHRGATSAVAHKLVTKRRPSMLFDTKGEGIQSFEGPARRTGVHDDSRKGNLIAIPRLDAIEKTRGPMRQLVLIVEDEPLLRMLAVDLVEEAGLEALEATNAEEAITLLERTPDTRILLTDIDMPGSMNGLELAWTVSRRWPSISTVLVSGKQPLAAREMPEGSVFFAKPYEPRKMVDLLLKMAN